MNFFDRLLSTISLIPRSVSNTPSPDTSRHRERRHAPEVEYVLQLVHRNHTRQVALVVLHHERRLAHVEVLLDQVLVQVPQTLDVVIQLFALRVRHENNAVRAAQHQLARRGVVHLAGNRVELKARCESGDRAEIERQKIEEQGAIGLGGERDHRALALIRHERVDVLQVRRLARPSRAVVDDLARDLAR